jgi:holo-[acyl-carrier-protein] synthase
MIGIDILENMRMEEKSKNPEFVKRFLTDEEQKYVSRFEDKVERMTGIFCAKEAVQKAFGCPSEMTLKTIEVRHFENGKPYIVFDKSLAHITKNKVVEISLSHSKTVTVAVAVVLETFDEHDCCFCDDCVCEDEQCDCEECNSKHCECEQNCDCDDCECTCECEECDCNDCKCEHDCNCLQHDHCHCDEHKCHDHHCHDNKHDHCGCNHNCTCGEHCECDKEHKCSEDCHCGD